MLARLKKEHKIRKKDLNKSRESNNKDIFIENKNRKRKVQIMEKT